MKLITHVSKGDDDPILQMEPHIFTLQCISKQCPRLCCLAEPTFQGPMQHPEQLEDWPDRENIPPSPETPALHSRHCTSLGAAHIHPQPECCQSDQREERFRSQRDGQVYLAHWDVPRTESSSQVPTLP